MLSKYILSRHKIPLCLLKFQNIKQGPPRSARIICNIKFRLRRWCLEDFIVTSNVLCACLPLGPSPTLSGGRSVITHSRSFLRAPAPFSHHLPPPLWVPLVLLLLEPHEHVQNIQAEAPTAPSWPAVSFPSPFHLTFQQCPFPLFKKIGIFFKRLIYKHNFLRSMKQWNGTEGTEMKHRHFFPLPMQCPSAEVLRAEGFLCVRPGTLYTCINTEPLNSNPILHICSAPFIFDLVEVCPHQHSPVCVAPHCVGSHSSLCTVPYWRAFNLIVLFLRTMLQWTSLCIYDIISAG